LVTGRVQGVFFRVTCRREAEARGVAGSAQNLPNGSVEVILEGERSVVEEMISWCRGGPAHARVEALEVVDEEPEGIRGFS
jgi:acylphosphatase